MVPALEKDSVVRKGKIRNQKAAIVAIAKKQPLAKIQEASESSDEVSIQLIDIDKDKASNSLSSSSSSSSSSDGSSSDEDIEKTEILRVDQQLEIKETYKKIRDSNLFFGFKPLQNFFSLRYLSDWKELNSDFVHKLA